MDDAERGLSAEERMRLWAAVSAAYHDETSSRFTDACQGAEYTDLVRSATISDIWADRGACVDDSAHERLREFRAKLVG